MEQLVRRQHIQRMEPEYFCMQRRIALYGKQKMEDIIQILSHMRVNVCFMNLDIWISAENIRNSMKEAKRLKKGRADTGNRKGKGSGKFPGG